MYGVPSRSAGARAGGSLALHALPLAARRQAARMHELSPARCQTPGGERPAVHRLSPDPRATGGARESRRLRDLSLIASDPCEGAVSRLPHRPRRTAGADRFAVRTLSCERDRARRRHWPRELHDVSRECGARAGNSAAGVQAVSCKRGGEHTDRALDLRELPPTALAALDAELRVMSCRQGRCGAWHARRLHELSSPARACWPGSAAGMHELSSARSATGLAPRPAARDVHELSRRARGEAEERSRDVLDLSPRSRKPRADCEDLRRLSPVRRALTLRRGDWCARRAVFAPRVDAGRAHYEQGRHDCARTCGQRCDHRRRPEPRQLIDQA